MTTKTTIYYVYNADKGKSKIITKAIYGLQMDSTSHHMHQPINCDFFKIFWIKIGCQQC